MNREFPDVQAGFRKGIGTRDQIANICWIMEKAREFQKNIYFKICFIDYAKAFDCVDHKLWKPLKEMEISNHLCFLINLYCLNYHTIALISHASKVMLKILQARLQQYVKTMNFQMFKLVLEKAEEPEIKLPTSAG